MLVPNHRALIASEPPPGEITALSRYPAEIISSLANCYTSARRACDALENMEKIG